MDSDPDKKTTVADSGKRKRENDPDSVDKYAAAKAKFDQTAGMAQVSTRLVTNIKFHIISMIL